MPTSVIASKESGSFFSRKRRRNTVSSLMCVSSSLVYLTKHGSKGIKKKNFRSIWSYRILGHYFPLNIVQSYLHRIHKLFSVISGPQKNLSKGRTCIGYMQIQREFMQVTGEPVDLYVLRRSSENPPNKHSRSHLSA